MGIRSAVPRSGMHKNRLQGYAVQAHDLPGGAKVTLKRIDINKGLLKRLELAIVRRFFDGYERLIVTIHGEQQTSIQCLPIDEHGASTTIAHVANFFGPS